MLTGCQTDKSVSLFDGKTLGKWKVTNFGGEGDVKIEDGNIVMEYGSPLTGVHWTGDDYPKMNYEITLEAKRVDGSDFFCGLTFRVGDDPCSLILGGWGGTVCGLSSLDGMDAANNETAMNVDFKTDKWYKVRVRVTKTNISAWLDKEHIVDAGIEGRKIGVRPEVESSEPLGICAFETISAIRNIRVRPLEPSELK